MFYSRVCKTLVRVATDTCGIPLRPTWSLRELVSSYPSPSLPPTTLGRLYELSALVPPKEGTPDYNTSKNELEELVRLVEAVKLAHVNVATEDSIPDGRVWAEGVGIPLTRELRNEDGQGTRLLDYAHRTLEDMYVVETAQVR